MTKGLEKFESVPIDLDSLTEDKEEVNYKVKIVEPEKHHDFNVGQAMWILSVNRHTMEMEISFDNPWPAHNAERKAELDAAGLELCEDGFSLRKKK